MISFVICSADEAKLEAMRRHLGRAFGTEPHEVVGIAGAACLASGYRDGLARAAGEIVAFCHDDIEFLGPDVAGRLKGHFERYDVVGVAGTDRLAGPSWTSAGPPHLFGQVAHRIENGYRACIYGAPMPAVGGIQALDGLFIAFRRETIEAVGWDAETFDGFHHYDLDCTFRAYLSGSRLAVACDLPVYHASSGSYDDQWQVYAHRFLQKHGGRIARRQSYPWHFTSIEVRTKQEALEAMTPNYWRG